MTERRLRMTWILGLLMILLALAGLAGYRRYEARFAWIGQTKYEKTIETLDRVRQPVEDLNQLRAFGNLKQIDLRETGLTCEEFDSLRSWFPEAQILWDIPFQGSYYDMSTDHLTVDVLTESDLAVLTYFTELRSIDAEQCRDYNSIIALMERWPQLDVRYKLWFGETSYDPATTELHFVDAELEQVEQMLPVFGMLQRVTLEGDLPDAQGLKTLWKQYPNVEFYWQVTVLGVPADIHTTELDLSGMPITSTEELEAAVEYLPNLTKVLMMDCGLSNEQMAQLNERHPDVLFVWNVRLGQGMVMRSDSTVFAPVKTYRKVYDRDLVNLRYLTELVVIDLGHMEITDVSFLEYMPDVRFLILADTNVSDLTPLSGLKKLQFLELFISPIRDYSPLVGCTALEDLNLSGTYADPEPLMQMTWLKRLWHVMRYMEPEQREALIAALPNTQVMTPTHGSTGGGWREGALYYEMRDLMGMPYMAG